VDDGRRLPPPLSRAAHGRPRGAGRERCSADVRGAARAAGDRHAAVRPLRRLHRPPAAEGQSERKWIVNSLVLTLVLLAGADTRAPHPLTLDDALARALAKNYTIAIEREAYASAGQRVRSEQGAYDVQLGLEAGYGRRSDPVNSLLSGAPAGAGAPAFRSRDFDA